MAEMSKKPAENQTENVGKSANEKKPTNLIRVNDSMIADTKQANLKSVTLGIRDPEGNEKVGKIFVSDKQVNPDKKTADLSKSQQKSYVALDRNKDYTFSVKTGKDADGKPVFENSKISGADIIEQNKAYMKERTAQRERNIEASVQEPSQQAETEAEGPVA